MAVTKGQGNPKWTREETALALELYLKREQKIPSSNDSEVILLSAYLRNMELHKDAHKNASFRNPDGVGFKIANLSAVATGKGLKHTAQMDQQVWEEFGFNYSALKEYCDLIRSGVHTLKSAPYAEPFEDDYEFSEGRVLTRLHKTRERNRGLRNKLIEKLKNTYKCHCEICKTEPKEALGDQAMSMFECHHIIPISEVYRAKTKISDLSLLCANCHRLLHALISKEKRWLKISEAAELLN